MSSVKVDIDKRTFYVDFNADGKPIRIKERKLYAEGSLFECYYNASYWSAKHHKIGSDNTMVARIIKKALND